MPSTVAGMPRRQPIDPQGTYHVGSRGNYGQPLYRTADQYELFLKLYARSATKYGWATVDWMLMENHHHFVIRLTNGGLSEGMRELHCTYSRRIHAMYGLTNQGHLVRHAFFARRLTSDADVLGTCRYIDRNVWMALGVHPVEAVWGGYAATVGLAHPRPFHSPAEILALLSPRPDAARTAYRRLVEEGLVPPGRGPSPNDRVGARD
jgi:REP element-mobilizing transposase RayT